MRYDVVAIGETGVETVEEGLDRQGADEVAEACRATWPDTEFDVWESSWVLSH